MNNARNQLELKASFMGGIRLYLGDQDLTRSSLPKKAEALLCYLILNTRTHSRQEIAGKFWPEATEAKARVSLRVALNKMKEQGLESFLIAPRPTLTFDHTTNYWCDVEAFEKILAGYRQDNVGDLRQLREAVDLYKGDFLDGFDAEDAFGFEEWMFNQREYLRQLALNALDELVRLYLEDDQFVAGIEYAYRLLELEPWRESAHRQLMWLFAKGGNRAAALEQYEKCREVLLNELGIEPDPETTAVYKEIKNLEYSTRPFQPLPPLSDLAENEGPPFQAPALDKHFVGRLQPIARLQAALTDKSRHRRYGLVGMGGVGKTTLAIFLAHQLRSYFADGILWATAVTSDPMEIAEKWANAFGYDFTGLKTLEERAQALRAMLAEKDVLIIVDDVFVASAVKLLLPDSEKTAVLITSRHTDVIFNLGARPVNLAELSAEDSKQLLINYIGQQRVEKEVEAAAQICVLLQYLPLAVSIAGGYLNSRPRRPLASFVAQLQDETNRLGLDHTSREVRASISISWQGLDDTQKRIFTVLGVFDGRDFDAEAIANIAEMEYYQTLDRLDDLVRLSLLQNSGVLRYQQHALLADYAKEQLDQNTGYYQRLVVYFLDFAGQAQEEYALLSQEWDNLRAGIETAYQHRMWQEVVNYTAILREPWFRHGRYSQAREAFAYAQEAAMALEDEEALAKTWLFWGQASMEQGDVDEAQNWLVKSLEEFEDLGSNADIGVAQYELARLALNLADYEGTQERLTKSLQIREELNDPAGIAQVIYRQAKMAHRLGENESALAQAKKALTIQEDLRDSLGQTRTRRLMAFIAIALKNYDLASQYATSALQSAKTCQDVGELAMAYYTMSGVYRRIAQLDKAQSYAQRSLALLQKIGDRESIATVHYQLCLICKSAGLFPEALNYGQICLPIFEETKNKWYLAYTHAHLGDLHSQLDDQNLACFHYETALALAKDLTLQDFANSLQNLILKQGC